MPTTFERCLRRVLRGWATLVGAWLVLASVAGFVGGVAFGADATVDGGDATLAVADAALPEGGALEASSSVVLEAGLSDAPIARDVAALRATAQRVRELMVAALDVTVDARTLFDCDLDDPRAVEVERARLQALLREVDASSSSSTSADSGTTDARAGEVSAADALDGAVEAALSFDAALSGTPLWIARLDLDRARLAFYELTPAGRQAVLKAHEQRQAAARLTSPESDASRRAREAEDEKQKALETARLAKSEAERAVAEEYARLLEVERAQAVFAEGLGQQSKATVERREATLRWQRQLRELRESAEPGQAIADATYDALRATLRESRSALSEALSGASFGAVPAAGPDPLAELQLATDQTLGERRKLGAEALKLESAAANVEAERLSELLDETTVLNRERLLLLPYLSAPKRQALVGFGAEGRDQATSELQQLTLIMRYHARAAVSWARGLRQPGSGVGGALARSGVVMLEGVGLALAFVWWRRRAQGVLDAASQRVREVDRVARAARPSRWLAVLEFVTGVRAPTESLLFVLAFVWLLPAAIQQALEIQLVFVVVSWMMGGRILVGAIDTLAVEPLEHPHAAGAPGQRSLRHRSLRLVSRVVVVFGVMLVATSKVVGEGTLYQWVLSTCWFASIPLFLVLIRWWRDVVFVRIARARKPSRFERWALANKSGWASFFAASGGALYLFGTGTAKAFRTWVSRFELTRKALAYLFRRRLDKMGAETRDWVLGPLDASVFDALGPSSSPPALWVKTEIDEELGALASRVAERRGGVVAIVGERGIGKTSALRKVVGSSADVLQLTTPPEGLEVLRARLAERLRLSADATLESVGAALVAAEDSAIVFDDFQHFVEPVMGGLASFDALLAVANRHSEKTTWIFAFDVITWQFLERARSVRPIFDEILELGRWREEEIAELLRLRTDHAGLAPSFEPLLEELPPDADEIDRREALDARAASFRRLVWDSAAGNPGVALHLWRRSLGGDAEGRTFVRVFPALELQDLERLPDSSVFVLRAVLQLSPAAPDRVVAATMLRPAEVNDALRYALSRGYLEAVDGRYRVTWTWFRAIALFLQRRHLLVST